MKLSEWAKRQGIAYKTAWRWFHSGQLPVPARQLPTGTILVDIPEPDSGKVVIYARVSSGDQKEDLDRQTARVVRFASEEKLPVHRVVTEVGSALTGKQPKLLQILADPDVQTILVEHKDRLMRFGFEYIEAALAAQGRQAKVVDPTEMKDDLVRDMIDVLTSFCARLYGKRSAKNRAKKAVEALQRGDPESL